MHKKLSIRNASKFTYGCYFLIAWFLSTGCNSNVSKKPVLLDSLIIKSKELIPEGIAIHPATGQTFLSSLHQNKIIWVDNDGNCEDLIQSGAGGFMKGIGIKISKDGKTLWACTASLDTVKSKSALFQIELESGRIIDSIFYSGDSSSLFNDIAIHSSGDIYFTDTFLGSVFRYRPSEKKLERWIASDRLTLANGIAFADDETILFVASGDKGIQRIDMQTKEISHVTQGKRIDYAVDGLVYHNNTLYGVIGWPQEEIQHHRVISYHLTDDHFLKSVDTLLTNNNLLKAPTTAAIHKERLFVLSKTNLGWYNKAAQSLNGVEDSLEFPVIVNIALSKK